MPVPPGAVPADAVAQLQSAIFNLSPPPAEPLTQPDDGSLRFVTCHSAQRELEVLHDQLLAWLEADPALHIPSLFALGLLLFLITFVVLGIAKWLTERSAMRAGN